MFRSTVCCFKSFSLSNTGIYRTSDFTLKIARYNPYMEESLEKYDPFKRELFFHQEVLPKIEELLLSVPDNTELTDKYAASSEVECMLTFVFPAERCLSSTNDLNPNIC